MVGRPRKDSTSSAGGRGKRALSKTAKSPGRGKAKRGAAAKSGKAKGAKRPKSAFIFFSMERREEIVKSDPGLKTDIGGVSKRIGAEWKSLDAAKKQKYESLAAQDRERYSKESAKSG